VVKPQLLNLVKHLWTRRSERCVIATLAARWKVPRSRSTNISIDGSRPPRSRACGRKATAAKSLLRRYVRPSLGDRNLAAICPLDIQAVYQRLVERGLSPRTIRYTHSVLRSAMRQAIRWRLLSQDPTDGAQLPRLRRYEMQVLTAEQSRLFLEIAMQTEYGPVFAVALTTAARPSEYLALKWQDINWERGT
jgi:integrase